MKIYLIAAVFLCAVFGHTLGLFVSNGHQLFDSKVGNTTDDCKKDACCLKIIDDVYKCVYDKEDKSTIEKHIKESKFICCLMGIEFDCVNSLAKTKCDQKDADKLKGEIDQVTKLLDQSECKEHHIKTGVTKCET
ncbi:uncharacterized protein LOC128958461 [Oppia nitens]|uniref:uncharacterized protein LOC128958461 n=1 Tax=Oppia nitens TaxID=1686743 RepID=UPI0023DB78C3|nr:uncharacterized protein LOC128958461 [Oppia nitens]